jgi:hypothetical protein
VSAVDVSAGAPHARPTVGNQLHNFAGFRELVRDGARAFNELDVVTGSGPHHLGIEEEVERDVPRALSRSIAGQNQATAEPKACCCRGGEPCVIALRRTARDEDRGTVFTCRPAQVLQLADLVAPAAKSGEVVALDPEVVNAQAEMLRQPRRPLERRRPRAERHPTGPRTPMRIHGSIMGRRLERPPDQPRWVLRRDCGPRRHPWLFIYSKVMLL